MKNKSILDKHEVSQAQVGARSSKDPRSKEYAIQTLYSIKRYAESEEYFEDLLTTEIARVERYEHWIVLGYESKDAMFAAELNGEALKKVQRLFSKTEKLPEWGMIGNGRGRDSTSTSGGRRDSAYLAARIKRDRPDIAERAEAGEFKSVRAAAIEAGIIKPLTPVDLLRRAWNKATPEQRKEFLKWTESIQ
jgi:hypothetical protein